MIFKATDGEILDREKEFTNSMVFLVRETFSIDEIFSKEEIMDYVRNNLTREETLSLLDNNQ